MSKRPANSTFFDRSSSLNEVGFDDFDQNPEKGWRCRAKQGKFSEAADLIQNYIDVNSHRLKPEQNYLLKFHAGQMLAMASMNNEAVDEFVKLIDAPTAVEFIFGYDATIYLKATIAFLKRNPEELSNYQQEIAIDLNHYPSGSNLIFIPGRVNDMLNNLNLSYREIFAMATSLPSQAAGGKIEWCRVNENAVYADTDEGQEIREKFNLKSPSQLKLQTH